MDAEKLSADLYQNILSARRDTAKTILEAAIAQSGYKHTLRNVLEPTLEIVGERWTQDRISLAQGFVAGKVAEDFVSMGQEYFSQIAARSVSLDGDPPGAPAVARIAVLGNIEDDYHSMGRSMVSTFLILKGWQVSDLGCDVLAKDFVDCAISRGACVIGASAMMLTTARNIQKVRDELNARGVSETIKLAVGGAVFKMRPELVGEVGGDGTAATALDAARLFESLRAEILAAAPEKPR